MGMGANGGPVAANFQHHQPKMQVRPGGGGVTMLQSIYADRLSDEVLAVSA